MATPLPDSLADSWQTAGRRTGTTTVMVTSITAETTLYEPIEATDALADLGTSDIPVRSLFIVEMTFSPPLSTFGITPRSVFSMAAPKAKKQFVDIVEADGLVVDGTRETHSFEAQNGAAGKWFVLDVSYPIDPDLGEEPDRLPAETHVAVWPTETTYGMAGGTIPLDMPTHVAAELDAEVTIDPPTDRERIAELISSIDPESELCT